MSTAVTASKATGYDASRMAAKRRSERALPVRKVGDPKRRAACEAEDCEWLRIYLPSVFRLPFTNDQKLIVEDIGQCLEFGLTKCIAAPRHDGKTSIARYLTMKYTLQKVEREGRLVPKVPLSLIITATGPKSGKSLAAIKHKLRAIPETPLWEDYPLEVDVARYVGPAPAKCNNVELQDGRRIKVEWGAEHIILPAFEDDGCMGGMLAALGITSNEIQGFNLYDVRPRFCILDDLDDRDSLASVGGGSVAAKIEKTVDENVAGLGGPGEPLGLVQLCTIPSRNSVAFKYSDAQQKPSWSGVRLKKIKAWPERKDLWEEYISLRQKGKQTFDASGRPTDKHGREAHRFLRANYDDMHRGAVVSNDHDFITAMLPDGSQTQVSALQNCYDYIADKGMPSFLTEYQNDPPEDELAAGNLVLTAYHIQNNCLSGIDKRQVPDGTICITRAGDVQKLGLHYVSIAWDEHASGCIIDYDFHEFMTEGRAAADCELAILEGLFAWHEAQQKHGYITTTGEVIQPDLTLIDMGWKEESWNTQPVQVFCGQVGFSACMPSKGFSPYHRPKDSRRTFIGDNWHVAFPGGVPIVEMNSDHWKLKVHEGFLSERGQPGSLALFDPPRTDGRKNRTAHLSFSKHILSETWESRFVPGFKGTRTGWWKSPKPNHYFDACYQAIVARSMWGLSVLRQAQAVAAPSATQVENAIAASPSVPFGGGESRSRW